MNTKLLTCKFGENAYLLKNERFMAQNAFVICGLMEAVMIDHKLKQDYSLNHIYGKEGTVDVLNVDYGALQVDTVRVDSKIANDHILTIHVNKDDDSEDILERVYRTKEISSLLTPCVESDFAETMKNDMALGFTYAEFQVASSNRKSPNKKSFQSFSIVRSAKLLGETLGQENVDFDVMDLVCERAKAVMDRIDEITHGQGFLR